MANTSSLGDLLRAKLDAEERQAANLIHRACIFDGKFYLDTPADRSALDEKLSMMTFNERSYTTQDYIHVEGGATNEHTILWAVHTIKYRHEDVIENTTYYASMTKAGYAATSAELDESDEVNITPIRRATTPKE